MCFEKCGFDTVGKQPLENNSDNEDDDIRLAQLARPQAMVAAFIKSLTMRYRGQRQQPGRLGKAPTGHSC